MLSQGGLVPWRRLLLLAVFPNSILLTSMATPATITDKTPIEMEGQLELWDTVGG